MDSIPFSPLWFHYNSPGKEILFVYHRPSHMTTNFYKLMSHFMCEVDYHGLIFNKMLSSKGFILLDILKYDSNLISIFPLGYISTYMGSYGNSATISKCI
jgi:hypothetical protein